MRSRSVGTSTERYAVVSCHVERVLDDRVWARLLPLMQRPPGGFPVAALIRPPDAAAGEDASTWLERAREAARHGPLGHHTHWTSPTHARPTGNESEAGERVLAEGRWLAEQGLAPSLFCGGGWYTDAAVAAACATLGYTDCTPRAAMPAYLGPNERWAELRVPARVRVAGTELVAVPTTHSVGDLVRALARPGGPRVDVVHAYFHDTDLLDARRRGALAAALRVLALRRAPARLDEVAARVAADAPTVAWNAIARGGTVPGPQ
jgi:hypothetical protein